MIEKSHYTIYGQVFDQKTGEGIVGATIIVDSIIESSKNITSQFGTYLLDIKSNVENRLTFQAKGYYPKTRGNITCSSHYFIRVDVALKPVSQSIENLSLGSSLRSNFKLVTLETAIINSPKRVEYSNRLKTWKVIK